MRAVIYARYSSDMQSARSIADQQEICRRYAEQGGFTVTGTYSDAALSGASDRRPGYQQLLADARTRSFDVVIVEHLDRLSRRLADISGLHDELTFHGIALHAVNVGAVTAMHVGLLGTMGQMQLAELRDKTRRGQLGRIQAGKAAGGLPYGYTADGQGERTVNPGEAQVVRRIFALYANGESPRAIAHRLNDEGVPGPGGRPWRDTAIRGQVARGTGILNNDFYIGRLVWNRCAYVKDPRSGKRVARPNPPEQHEVVEVPDLRIVDDALWNRVKARQKALQFQVTRDNAGNALNRAHRRHYLLSGLLVCGVCGGGYTIAAKDRYVCATRRTQGTCSNSLTITRQAIEARVLAGLKERLLAPEMIQDFIAAFQAEAERARQEQHAASQAAAKELKDVQQKLDALVRAIENGADAASLKDRLSELEARKAELERQMADTGDTTVVDVHPDLAAVYRRKVEHLETALQSDHDDGEAMAVLRSMIARIVLTPAGNAGGLDAVLHGDLARILNVCAAADSANTALDQGANTKIPGRGAGDQLSVVAGVGFEPTTFRL